MPRRLSQPKLAGNDPGDGAFGTTDGGTTVGDTDRAWAGRLPGGRVPGGPGELLGEMASELAALWRATPCGCLTCCWSPKTWTARHAGRPVRPSYASAGSSGRFRRRGHGCGSASVDRPSRHQLAAASRNEPARVYFISRPSPRHLLRWATASWKPDRHAPPAAKKAVAASRMRSANKARRSSVRSAAAALGGRGHPAPSAPSTHKRLPLSSAAARVSALPGRPRARQAVARQRAGAGAVAGSASTPQRARALPLSSASARRALPRRPHRAEPTPPVEPGPARSPGSRPRPARASAAPFPPRSARRALPGRPRRARPSPDNEPGPARSPGSASTPSTHKHYPFLRGPPASSPPRPPSPRPAVAGQRARGRRGRPAPRPAQHAQAPAFPPPIARRALPGRPRRAGPSPDDEPGPGRR